MDRSEVRKIVERELEPLKARLGLSHWSVTVDFDLREPSGDFSTRGQCNFHVDYDKATICFDPDQLDDESEVLHVLRHELFHIVVSPFSIFMNSIRPFLNTDPVKADMADSVLTHAMERAVINIERMFEGLTGKPPESPTVLVTEPDGPPVIS
jgi:hypothetical protein